MADDDEEEMNPAIIRLSKELKKEMANGRLLKKNWRQAQADHHSAHVEVTRLKSELEMTLTALYTSQEIEARLETELTDKQNKFTKSDVRAGIFKKDLCETTEALEKSWKVEKTYTKDLISLRTDKQNNDTAIKELSKVNASLKHELIKSQESCQAITIEVKELRTEASRLRFTEQNAKAKCADLSQKQITIIKEMKEMESQRLATEAYAIKMKDEAKAATKYLKGEKELTKKLTAELSAKTHEWINEREKCMKAETDYKEVFQSMGIVRKGKNDIEAVARGVARDNEGKVKTLGERDAKIEMLTETLDGRMADIDVLRNKLKASEATAQKLKSDLTSAHTTVKMLRVTAASAHEDVKTSVAQTNAERKKVQDERNSALAIAREVQAVKHELKKSDAHSGDCEDVIGRLQEDMAREHNKFVNADDTVKSLTAKLQDSEHRLHMSAEKVAQLEREVKEFTESLGMARRAGKDSAILATKLGTDGSEVKANLRISQTEAARVSETLEKYRQDLLESEIHVENGKAAVAKLEEELKLKDHKVGELEVVVGEQKKQIEIVLEIEHMAERTAQQSQRVTESVALQLHEARIKTKEAEKEVAPLMEVSKRHMTTATELEAKLQDREMVIEKLKIQVAANLERAVNAEDVNTGHEEKVARLEDIAALAQRGDSTASAVTSKIATKLYEAQKKIPPMELEVATYKDQVRIMVDENEVLRSKASKREMEITKLKEELDACLKETYVWRFKVGGIEGQIPPLKDKILFLEAQNRDEEALKREMTMQLHANRKRLAEAEEQEKILTGHVERLVDQLKSEGRDPNQEERSQKNPGGGGNVGLGGLMQRVKALPNEQTATPTKMPARKFMKGSESLPQIR